MLTSKTLHYTRDLTAKRRKKGFIRLGNANCTTKRVTKSELFGLMGWESEEGFWESKRRTSY